MTTYIETEMTDDDYQAMADDYYLQKVARWYGDSVRALRDNNKEVFAYLTTESVFETPEEWETELRRQLAEEGHTPESWMKPVDEKLAKLDEELKNAVYIPVPVEKPEWVIGTDLDF